MYLHPFKNFFFFRNGLSCVQDKDQGKVKEVEKKIKQ